MAVSSSLGTFYAYIQMPTAAGYFNTYPARIQEALECGTGVLNVATRILRQLTCLKEVINVRKMSFRASERVCK